MPAKRRRTGARTKVAAFQQHSGTVDDYGTPTYTNDDDWSTVVAAWPAEQVGVRGGEVIRGRQVAAVTTDVLFGEYYGGSLIASDMRCVLNGVIYQVVSAVDTEGMNRELRVELKREL